MTKLKYSHVASRVPSAVVFHSSLTVEQNNKLEMIQKTFLKVIIGENYVSYASALEMCGLKTLSERRQDRCLNFATKSSKHPRNNRLFPIRPKDEKGLRITEPFKVNFASGGKYKNSAMPHCQRLLNSNHQLKTKK